MGRGTAWAIVKEGRGTEQEWEETDTLEVTRKPILSRLLTGIIQYP